jgi:hypothetical protein
MFAKLFQSRSRSICHGIEPKAVRGFSPGSVDAGQGVTPAYIDT